MSDSVFPHTNYQGKVVDFCDVVKALSRLRRLKALEDTLLERMFYGHHDAQAMRFRLSDVSEAISNEKAWLITYTWLFHEDVA